MHVGDTETHLQLAVWGVAKYCVERSGSPVERRVVSFPVFGQDSWGGVPMAPLYPLWTGSAPSPGKGSFHTREAE